MNTNDRRQVVTQFAQTTPVTSEQTPASGTSDAGSAGPVASADSDIFQNVHHGYEQAFPDEQPPPPDLTNDQGDDVKTITTDDMTPAELQQAEDQSAPHSQTLDPDPVDDNDQQPATDPDAGHAEDQDRDEDRDRDEGGYD
ncbi:MAG: hypothetical protein E6Q76_07510 [Rhizobium sp.]|nr:MAG: hypothetical protein E6Q76_07510 [Rhizobium sp.]